MAGGVASLLHLILTSPRLVLNLVRFDHRQKQKKKQKQLASSAGKHARSPAALQAPVPALNAAQFVVFGLSVFVVVTHSLSFRRPLSREHHPSTLLFLVDPGQLTFYRAIGGEEDVDWSHT